MARVKTEHEEQREFVAWFRRVYPNVRITAIPNGGHRMVSVAGRLKAEGVSPGVPDLFIPEWSLWIEMKRSVGGHLSKHQKDWIAYLTNIGHTCYVAKGFENAKKFICRFRGQRLI